VLLLGAVAALSAWPSASAAQDQPLAVVLGRHCGPSCADFIVAEGEIEGLEYREIAAAWSRAGSRPLPLVLHSPGGNIDLARGMGDMLAGLGMTVVVARAVPAGSTRATRAGEVRPFVLTARGAFCASACALAIAGAKRRVVPPGARLGVHGPSLDTSQSLFGRSESAMRRATDQAYAMLADYYAARGIAPSIMDFVRSAGPDGMRWLTRDEMRRVGLIDAGPQALPFARR
jgi:hypothetical protein